MKRIPLLFTLLAALALGAAACAVPGPTGEGGTGLNAAGQILDLSVVALDAAVDQMAASYPDKAQALKEKTGPALAAVKTAAVAYHAAVAAGDPDKTTDERWAAAKTAMGGVIDAAMPIVGRAAIAALGL